MNTRKLVYCRQGNLVDPAGHDLRYELVFIYRWGDGFHILDNMYMQTRHSVYQLTWIGNHGISHGWFLSDTLLDL